MFATAYMPSTGLNRMMFDRVYGSSKALNSSGSGDDSITSPSETRGRHKHSRHHKSHHHHHHHHHHGSGSTTADRLRQEETLMHASTHSEGCTHLEDHFPDVALESPNTPNTPSRTQRSVLRRNSSIPDNMGLASPDTSKHPA